MLTITTSARSARHGFAHRGAQSSDFERQRVGLIDAAAEGHDGVLHCERLSADVAIGTACPSNECATPRRRRDRLRASKRRPLARRPSSHGHRAATRSPSPFLTPAETRSTSGHSAATRSSPSMRCRRSARHPGSRRAASTTPTCGSAAQPRISRRQARPSPRPSSIGVSGSAIIGSTTCASGSPKRTLNSMTLGPSRGEHQAAVQNAAIRRRLRRPCPRARAGRSRAESSRAASASTSGARRERAHPTGVRSAIVVEDSLVILRRDERNRARRRRRSRRTRLPALRDAPRARPRAGVAEGAVDHRGLDRRFRLVHACSATTTPLPAASPSALTTTRAPKLAASGSPHSASAASAQTR